jgi:hypothetical protein
MDTGVERWAILSWGGMEGVCAIHGLNILPWALGWAPTGANKAYEADNQCACGG